jgi:glutaredoxin 3
MTLLSAIEVRFRTGGSINSRETVLAKPVELYTTAGCPYSAAAREDLEWRGVDFVEYDVERNRDAYERMLELSGGKRTVPVIVEENKPIQVGWMGQGCSV